jgi:hypothetical protein
MRNQTQDKHHQEKEKTDLGNSCRRKGDKSESQGPRNQCNHQEHQRVVQHIFSPSAFERFLSGAGRFGPIRKQDNPANQ